MWFLGGFQILTNKTRGLKVESTAASLLEVLKKESGASNIWFEPTSEDCLYVSYKMGFRFPAGQVITVKVGGLTSGIIETVLLVAKTLGHVDEISTAHVNIIIKEAKNGTEK